MLSTCEIAIVLFGLVLGLQALAYIPQVIAIHKDPHGAKAVSRTTWGIFAACHTMTVAYTVITIADWRVALTFGANAAFCLVIVALSTIKRRAYRAERLAADTWAAPVASPQQHAASDGSGA